MDDDSLYVVLKVYGQLHRNERERPEEKSSGRFFHAFFQSQNPSYRFVKPCFCDLAVFYGIFDFLDNCIQISKGFCVVL